MGGEPTSAVLFDFSETLFAPAPEDEWIRAAATRADWVISDSDATRVANELASAFARPELAGLQPGRDLSPQSHRAALTAVFSAVESVAAGFADALYEELLEPEFWRPYPNTVIVLGRLRMGGGLALSATSHGISGRALATAVSATSSIRLHSRMSTESRSRILACSISPLLSLMCRPKTRFMSETTPLRMVARSLLVSRSYYFHRYRLGNHVVSTSSCGSSRPFRSSTASTSGEWIPRRLLRRPARL
jgi:hypothetical protein